MPQMALVIFPFSQEPGQAKLLAARKTPLYSAFIYNTRISYTINRVAHVFGIDYFYFPQEPTTRLMLVGPKQSFPR